MDDYAKEHLRRWITQSVHVDDDYGAVEEAMTRAATDDPVWLDRGWNALYTHLRREGTI